MYHCEEGIWNCTILSTLRPINFFHKNCSLIESLDSYFTAPKWVKEKEPRTGFWPTLASSASSWQPTTFVLNENITLLTYFSQCWDISYDNNGESILNITLPMQFISSWYPLVNSPSSNLCSNIAFSLPTLITQCNTAHVPQPYTHNSTYSLLCFTFP